MAIKQMQFPAWPHYADDEIEAVAAVLRSGRVNAWTGRDVEAFEQEYAGYCGVSHAIALANGTLALEAGLVGLGLQPGDEVIVTSRTFIASAAAIVLRGGVPVFADVDAESQNLDPKSVAALIGPRTVGIVAVHLAGWPCNMDILGELAGQNDLWILEDCAQAHGAQWRGRPVGSFGNAAAFSFCQDKILSTGGEGGMLVTDDEQVYRLAWSFKDHGKDMDLIDKARASSSVGCQWVHASIGSNWRMTGPQAAIGRLQLGKLEQWRERRNAHAQILLNMLRDAPALRIPEPPAHVRHAYYKFYAFVRPEVMRANARDEIIRASWDRGLPVSAGTCSEIYLEGAFASAGLGPEQRLPMARKLGETSLMLPVHPTLEDEHVRFVGENLVQLAREFSA